MKRKIFLILCVIFTVNAAIADSESYGPIIQRQSKQIQELNSRVLELENTLEEIKINLNNTGALTNKSVGASVSNLSKIIGEEAAEAILLPNETNTFFKNETTAQSGPQDKSDYDLALAALQEGKLDAAEKQFFDFIKNYPNSILQSNATFWYSETFYRRGVFDKAAINYLQSYKKYPTGSKAPDALLKLAYSLASLNKNKEACSMLEKLETEFPKRPISSIKRTSDAKSKFRCK
ncbi:MAG: tol-pal system protein YbgF [Rickettsiaceae bacterium]|nr:tol-pal system protein YbgF [Rickettsiaceae bacterium]MDP4832234.1 tol-pal system protein YbgF [Rickettsiaceae bacterium]MDP5020978.1 tol-pal system protein YbgF [Rickettsiaceae bacterium]MDP5083258.1 tol-pal system protein YbgF [Rickettsiaceae bacterium]